MVDAMMNHHVDNNRASSSLQKPNKKQPKEDDTFWSSTNNSEERQKIREFWLQLGEEERRSLVKVEKEAVLRKMKEQQKHSCNCSVCGKKRYHRWACIHITKHLFINRTAIEDELEVLYDAYYEELEQYANHQQQTRSSINPLHGYLSSDLMYDHTYDDTDPLDDDDEDDEDDDDDDDEDEEDDEEDEKDVKKAKWRSLNHDDVRYIPLTKIL